MAGGIRGTPETELADMGEKQRALREHPRQEEEPEPQLVGRVDRSHRLLSFSTHFEGQLTVHVWKWIEGPSSRGVHGPHGLG